MKAIVDAWNKNILTFLPYEVRMMAKGHAVHPAQGNALGNV